MCTVSWLPEAGGYHLFTNRDERLTRAPALPAEARQADGVPFLAPLDGDAGGTWVLVNAFGLTVTLLNRWGVPGDVEPAEPRSRGLLALELASAPSIAQAAARLTPGRLGVTRPCTLVLVEPGRPAWIGTWDGRVLTASEQAAAGFLRSSSSVTEPEVLASRRALFDRLRPVTAVGLAALHRSHAPARGKLSVCMHRDDAATQAATRIEVTATEVRMLHTPGAPCVTAPSAPLTLARQPLPLTVPA